MATSNVKESVKTNIASGVSSAVGAVAGMMASSAAAHEVNLAEVEEITSTPEHTQTQQHTSTPVHTPKPQPEVKPQEPVHQVEHKPEQISEQTTTQEPEVTIEVLDFQRTEIEGHEVDVALVEVNDNPVMILDTNLDGMADMMVADLNGNQMIDENEIIAVEDPIAMSQFSEAAAQNIAQNDMPDYVNDADVDTFMA